MASNDAIRTLVSSARNRYQADRIAKLVSANNDDKLYLINYEYGEFDYYQWGTFTVQGSHLRGLPSTYRVVYTAVGDEDVDGPTFTCNCQDQKINARRYGTCCKHICFVVCRVGGILNPRFFDSHIFTPEEHHTFDTKLLTLHIFEVNHNANGNRERTNQHPRTISVAKSEEYNYNPSVRPLSPDDTCPICYIEFDPDNETLLTCPECSNHVHSECMRAWLYTQKTCVLCRSDCWRHYK